MTRLYFPADARQLKAVVERIFNDSGVRYVFSTRSKVPYILKEDGSNYFGDGYKFVPGRDEIIREGSAGYIVSYGDMLYRSLDAVERARAEGLDVGLVNKPTLNQVDERMMGILGRSPFVLIVEGQNINTGLGVRFGTWMLRRGFAPHYEYMGVYRPGHGGIAEHVPYQGLSPEHIYEKIQSMAG